MRPADEAWILGIAASHNGAACLLKGNQVVCAIQEERLSRIKRDRIRAGASSLAVQYCLDAAGITPADLDLVVACTQSPASDPDNDLSLNRQLQLDRHGVRYIYKPHHLSHAASALAMSGERSAAILVIDGAGSPFDDLTANERDVVKAGGHTESVSLYVGGGGVITALEKHLSESNWLESRDPGMSRFSSLGGMYSAVAKYIFGDPMEAGKVMGLAPLGRATIPASDFFELRNGVLHFKTTVPDRFPGGQRWPANQGLHADLAASVQAALEEAVLATARRLRHISGAAALCYAGGVALNGIANERILRESGFKRLYVPAPAEDSGTAIGAAYLGYWELGGNKVPEALQTDSVGRTYSASDIDLALLGAPFVARASADCDDVVDRLVAGQIGGWFQGGSELGPRALGHRSIIADPRNPTIKSELNSRIKKREGFRPFAPAVLEEAVDDWFDTGPDKVNPFMLRIWRFKPGMMEKVPAAAHADYSGRAQTVSRIHSPAFHELISRFGDRTGIPILLNTSFNGPGEPIVETPSDALWTMAAHGLDFVSMEGRLIPRGALNSLLDLVPRLLIRDEEPPELDEDLRLPGWNVAIEPLSKSPGILVMTQTPWGPRRRWLPMGLMPVLDAIDGARSGHDLQHRLQQDGYPQSPDQMINIIARLREQNVIRLDDVAA